MASVGHLLQFGASGRPIEQSFERVGPQNATVDRSHSHLEPEGVHCSPVLRLRGAFEEEILRLRGKFGVGPQGLRGLIADSVKRPRS